MFHLGTDWWEIILRTVVIYAALVAGFRITGKRQIGQMAPFDLVVILLIANAVQNAMVGADTSLVGGLISAGALLVVNIAVSRVSRRFGVVEELVEGHAAVLMSDGQLIPQALAREGISRDELIQAIREHGLAGLDEVKMAVLEVDGSISIVPSGTATIRTKRRFRLQHHN